MIYYRYDVYILIIFDFYTNRLFFRSLSEGDNVRNGDKAVYHTYIHTFIHLFIHSFIHSFIRLFIHSFIH